MMNTVGSKKVWSDCRHTNFVKNGTKIHMNTRNDMMSSWSNWTDVACSVSTFMRTRLCPDCSKKRFPVHCSHHVQGENFTCVMIEGTNLKPHRVSHRSMMIGCQNSQCSISMQETAHVLVVVISPVSFLSLSEIFW